MGFVSLSVIIIIGIIIGAILINFLRGVMFLTLISLILGIVYYIFLATPAQKLKLDTYANKFSQTIYKLDKNEIEKILDNTKNSFYKIKKEAEEKIKELKH